MRFFPLFVAVGLASGALGAINATLDSGRTCGTVSTDEFVSLAETSFASKLELDPEPEAKSSGHGTFGSVELKVYWHVIASGKTKKKGYVPKSQVTRNIQAINRHYAKSGISFKLVSLNYTINQKWFKNAANAINNTEQYEMKKELRKGGPADINIYTVGFLSDEGEGTLGYATFPSQYADNPQDDGVVILFSTLPGGSTEKYNEGKTLTHELGHWLGLYHTFQGGCEGPGDFVGDTPPEKIPGTGCAYGRDTCPGGGKDPIHNFMDYSFDSCLNEFTSGQFKRIKQQIRLYRGIKF
ncbi:Extracellular metalloprotease 1 OS=Coccidioides posadasii (strain C735) GN=MEP1 PE=1 SV=1 [Rhizoctonia solani AG-1 IB]|uniref:Extracellular metalloprotease 1 n=1 Tax=Thanatephorus cucumeris (strain AG1-IB / isolate 7/3/14) TaxID=1108050 RepID=A0A0B7FST1_THACB|nr:Extracellular metalloprotease 1 OS=Coccidioides posadasii (strain C735) GN=MEP1 PE=1 SV=1 [Rhizoctonia solani AG-1 IB]